jgi:hypothetical protein
MIYSYLNLFQEKNYMYPQYLLVSDLFSSLVMTLVYNQRNKTTNSARSGCYSLVVMILQEWLSLEKT